jgi:hypothetical protein
MVEYGGGISKGPAGQVGGGGGSGGAAPDFGGGDPFANISNAFDGAVGWLGSLAPIELAAVIAVVFTGLVVLRRAF